MADLTPQLVPLERLKPAPWNPRLIRDARFKNLCKSIAADPDLLRLRPILAQEDGTIYAGNMRYRAVEHLKKRETWAVVDDVPDKLAKERALKDNQQWGEWQDDQLAEMLYELKQTDSELDLLGFEQDEIDRLLESVSGGETPGDDEQVSTPTLSDRFIVPPFSVLDARQGYWQERKRKWLAIGILSELGRGDQPRSSAGAAPGEEPTYRQISSGNGLLGFSEQARSHYANATPGGSTLPPATLSANGHTVRGDGRGRALGLAIGTGQWVREVKGDDFAGLGAQQSGTSIFDPVLCELAYRWFCPPAGKILDPMAGGSVRGIVASLLGRSYTGIELRPEQVAANREQIHLAGETKPVWIEGDALNVDALAPGTYDLMFTCPPYADLERYSDDPRDLSTMGYEQFLAAYREIIDKSCALLDDNRFACVVVGDVRDAKGNYRAFISDTIMAFRDAGLDLYNDAILVTAVGSLPIRVAKQFSASRKLGKTHQNVLVFIKGDARKATAACGDVEVALPEDDAEFGEEL